MPERATVGRLLQVSIKSICVTLEAGVGHRTIPMLLAKSSFHGHVTNYFTLISIHSQLDMEVRFCFSSARDADT